MNDARIIGKRLKTLRDIKGVSREKLAKKLNVSVSAIAMYELGERIPRDEIKVRIANYYEVSVESIFFKP